MQTMKTEVQNHRQLMTTLLKACRLIYAESFKQHIWS